VPSRAASPSDSRARNAEWLRFLNYMEREVRPRCSPQRPRLAGGPFAWLQALSGTSFGNRVGPLIVRFFLEEDLAPRMNAGHDFTFRNTKIELKTGTKHSTEGTFLFEQIRPQQDWDLVLCLGLCVESLVFFVLTRRFVETAIEAWRANGRSVITPQRGGSRTLDRASARPDTFWMWTHPEWARLLSKWRLEFGAAGWSGKHLRDVLASLDARARRERP